MNKRFCTAAILTASIVLTGPWQGVVLARGGFGGGFHGGGFRGGGGFGGGARFSAPRMSYGGFHGGAVGGYRGVSSGMYRGGSVGNVGANFYHGSSLNYSRGYGGVNSAAGRLGGYGGLNNAAMTHHLGVSNQNVFSNRLGASTNVNRVTNINNISRMNAGWNRGYWNGHEGGWGGNWGGYGMGYGGYGMGYGGYGMGYGSGLLWGLGLGSALGYGLGGYGMGYGLGGYGMGYGGYGMGYGGYGSGYGGGYGLSSWGMGGWPYQYGYMSYSNPYYTAGANSVYDYSQPIVMDTSAQQPAQTAVEKANTDFDSARTAFKAGNYDEALRLVDQAITSLPNDPDLHQFRGVALFAVGRYTEAAAALHSVLAVSPGWNWATLVGLYPDVDTFTTQLRTLEQYCAEHKSEAAPRFDLAYLYLTMGTNDAAVAELREVTRLLPSDSLSAQLLGDLSTSTSASARGTGNPPPNPESNQAATPSTASEATNPPPKDLTGTWKAKGAGDAAIELSLQPDGRFTWSATVQGKNRSFSGQYTVGGGLLTLASSDGPAIVGRISGVGNGFNFRMVGSGAGDPGLTFNR